MMLRIHRLLLLLSALSCYLTFTLALTKLRPIAPPILHFTFDSGALTDLSGQFPLTTQKAQGSGEGIPAPERPFVEDRCGLADSAVQGGDSTYLSASIPLLPQGPVARSITLWINCAANSVPKQPISLVQWGDGTAAQGTALQLRAYEERAAPWLPLTTEQQQGIDVRTPTVCDSQWHQLGLTYDLHRLQLFQDGLRIGSAIHDLDASAGSTLHIGWDPSSGSEDTFSGALDDVRVYAYALTTTQMASQWFAALTCGQGEPVVASGAVPTPLLHFTFDSSSLSDSDHRLSFVPRFLLDTPKEAKANVSARWTSFGPDKCGRADSAVKFEAGARRYLSVRSVYTLPQYSHARTISAWVNCAPAHVVANSVIAWGAGGPGQASALMLGTGLADAAHVFPYFFAAGGVDLAALHSRSMCDSTWHHFAATYDGTRATLFQDGAFQATKDLTLRTSGSDLTLGWFQPSASNSASGNNGLFVGLIDEVAIWSEALTEAQIKEAYDAFVSCGADPNAAAVRSGPCNARTCRAVCAAHSEADGASSTALLFFGSICALSVALSGVLSLLVLRQRRLMQQLTPLHTPFSRARRLKAKVEDSPEPEKDSLL